MQDIYTSLIQSGELKADPFQQRALRELESLRKRVVRSGRYSGGFSSVFRRKHARAPRGLYMWGSVGCGKSMLMDMFYGAVSIPKQKIHFLEFMQQIHGELHEIRKSKTKDVLAPVAERIAGNCSLLCLDEIQVDEIADGVIVGRLLEKLFALGVAVCTTSNRPPDDLCKDGLNRHLLLPYIEILKDNMVVHEFGSDRDHRRERWGSSGRTSPAAAARNW